MLPPHFVRFNAVGVVLWAGGGNVPPQLSVARQLVARGHRVRMLAPAALRNSIEAAGMRRRFVVQPSDPGHRVELRHAKALAVCANTTVMKAAPEAAMSS